jgi:NTP pyrophosphatase (non-canonical NTP hydrolase)
MSQIVSLALLVKRDAELVADAIMQVMKKSWDSQAMSQTTRKQWNWQASAKTYLAALTELIHG